MHFGRIRQETRLPIQKIASHRFYPLLTFLFNNMLFFQINMLIFADPETRLQMNIQFVQ